MLAPLAQEDEEAVAAWIFGARPLVVARRLESDAPGALRLGLALPGKRRIGVQISGRAVTRRSPPLLFLDAAVGMIETFPDAGLELARRMAAHAPDTKVFGSLAWRTVADDPSQIYLTARSDIDLLSRPQTRAQMWDWIALLQEFERAFPAPRLDGEIALPDGGFVAWRELAARPSKVVVKSGAGVALRRRDEIEALLQARAA
ncbi:phosphoribosyl-dephospho-CoA transferase [Rhodoblastus acidophilus]|nr:phosphoribosyl-dephospho-CoA transferase [Rhodoblastus acidophilus]MCW2335482.1 phosphoribosyl-dephospho-CoA transferase [Rhodoblastus acidophilus]